MIHAIVPFNANGVFIGNIKVLEELIDKTKNYSFIAMKTFVAEISTKIDLNNLHKEG